MGTSTTWPSDRLTWPSERLTWPSDGLSPDKTVTVGAASVRAETVLPVILRLSSDRYGSEAYTLTVPSPVIPPQSSDGNTSEP